MTDTWRPIKHADFYRVQNTITDRHNDAIAIPRNSDRYWLARLDQAGASINAGTPKLEVFWNAEDIVFLARGHGPFLLAYANASAVAANASLSPLLSGVGVLQAQLGAPRSLGGSARLQLPPPGFPWTLTVLWAVLGIGVALLAWMAYRLSRELRETT